MNEPKEKIEAVLFAIGRKITVDEISQITKIADKNELVACLHMIKDEYDERRSPMMLSNEGEFWKMTVRDEHLNIIQNIVNKTELDKQTTETLAVIAYKAPVLQSQVIKIRTNKAYDHLKILEDMGYITREPSGRTKLIKIGQHFLDYFDIPSEQMKTVFKSIEQAEKVVEQKEAELKEIKQQVKEMEKSKEEKKEDEVAETQKEEESIKEVENKLLSEGVIAETENEEEKKEEYEIELDEEARILKEKKKLKKEKEKRKKEREKKKQEIQKDVSKQELAKESGEPENKPEENSEKEPVTEILTNIPLPDAEEPDDEDEGFEDEE
jgi:segregation and condensation protein B